MALSVYSNEYFMGEALKQATNAYEDKEVPVGAVVVANNRIIARAYNQTEKLNDATAHAEMLAITSAFNFLGSKYLPDCTIYVTLEPCVMCAGALQWAQIGKLVYGTADYKKGYSLIAEKLLHPKTEVLSGVLADECSSLLTRFFDDLRK